MRPGGERGAAPEEFPRADAERLRGKGLDARARARRRRTGTLPAALAA